MKRLLLRLSIFFGFQRRGSVVPLNEEFADLFESGQRFVKRLKEAAFIDLPDFTYSNGRTADHRELLLRATAVMPSVAIEALAKKIKCDPRHRSSLIHLGISFPNYHRIVPSLARKIGADPRFILMCWKTEANLDQQWRALRRELLTIRAEWAAKA
jgi:hypothetical protein